MLPMEFRWGYDRILGHSLIHLTSILNCLLIGWWKAMAGLPNYLIILLGLSICKTVKSRHSKSNVRKSNSIELNPWIEFDWVRQSNEIEHHTFSEFDLRTNRIQSNKSNSIELNPSDCVRLSSETELNRTQFNGFRSIGSYKPIQSKPKASPLLFIQ